MRTDADIGSAGSTPRRAAKGAIPFRRGVVGEEEEEEEEEEEKEEEDPNPHPIPTPPIPAPPATTSSDLSVSFVSAPDSVSQAQ